MSSSLSLLDHFSALDDPRQRWRVIYPLPEILLLVLCATLCGMDDFVEIRLWGEQRLDFLRLFADPPPGLIADTHESLDADHGRFERRRHSVCHDVTWLTSDRRYPHEPHVPHLAMIGMSETAIERPAKPCASAATISPRPSSTPRPSPLPCAPTGTSRTACTGSRRRLPRRPRPAAHRLRSAKHGRCPTHRHEPRARPTRQTQPQEPPKARQSQPGLPRNPHPTERSASRINLKRSPWRRVDIPGSPG